MIHPVLAKQLEDAQHRLDEIRSRAGTRPEPHILFPHGFEEGNQSLEELRVAKQQLGSDFEDLEAERYFYHRLLEFGPDAYLVTDAEGHIRQANREAGRLLGIQPKSLKEKPLIIFVAEAAHDRFRRLVAEIRAGQIIKEELPIRPDKGLNFMAEIHVLAARTEEGIFLLRWMIRDVRRCGLTEQAPTYAHPEPPLQQQQFQAIGRMLAGLADTTRQAMERSQSGLEKLASEIQDQPQALEFLTEVQQAQEELRRLHESIGDFAVPVLLEQH